MLVVHLWCAWGMVLYMGVTGWLFVHLCYVWDWVLYTDASKEGGTNNVGCALVLCLVGFYMDATGWLVVHLCCFWS